MKKNKRRIHINDLAVINTHTDFFDLYGFLCVIKDITPYYVNPIRVEVVRLGYIVSRAFKKKDLSFDKNFIFNKLWGCFSVGDEINLITPTGKIGFQEIWKKYVDGIELSYTHLKDKKLLPDNFSGIFITKDTFKKDLFSRGYGLIYKRKNKLHENFETAIDTTVYIPVNYFKSRKEVSKMNNLLKRLLSPELRLLSKYVLDEDGNLDMGNPLVQQALLETDGFRTKLIELCKKEEKKENGK